jgi:hypothetical protein
MEGDHVLIDVQKLCCVGFLCIAGKSVLFPHPHPLPEMRYFSRISFTVSLVAVVCGAGNIARTHVLDRLCFHLSLGSQLIPREC